MNKLLAIIFLLPVYAMAAVPSVGDFSGYYFTTNAPLPLSFQVGTNTLTHDSSTNQLPLWNGGSWPYTGYTQQTPDPGNMDGITPALAGAGAGNLSAGVYRYALTITTEHGETTLGTSSQPITVVAPGSDGQVNVTIPDLTGLGGLGSRIFLASGVNLYRTKANGSQYFKVSSYNGAGQTTGDSFTDNTADSDLTSLAPTTNTAVEVLLNVSTNGVLNFADATWNYSPGFMSSSGGLNVNVADPPDTSTDGGGVGFAAGAGSSGGNVYLAGGYAIGTNINNGGGGVLVSSGSANYYGGNILLLAGFSFSNGPDPGHGGEVYIKGGSAANNGAGGNSRILGGGAAYGATNATPGHVIAVLGEPYGITNLAAMGHFKIEQPIVQGTDPTIGGTNLVDVDGFGTFKLNGQLQLLGTTNQVVFGSTNTAPVSSAAPTKWISVKVQGESTVYRLPLYQ